MRLSDRLASLNQAYGMMYDDYETMAEAIELAKRYEDAPVGCFEDVADTVSYIRWANFRDTSITIEQSQAMDGQRVRIVLDKEG